MLEHGRAVARQMFAQPDGSPLGPADQLGAAACASSAQVAQVVAVVFNQVEGDKDHLATAPPTAQRIEFISAVVAEDDGFAAKPLLASAMTTWPQWNKSPPAEAPPAGYRPLAIRRMGGDGGSATVGQGEEPAAYDVPPGVV
jgi:hypothetical protein